MERGRPLGSPPSLASGIFHIARARCSGVQGFLQLELLLLVGPIVRARVYDISADRAREV
jgi:hypothetical protein